MLLVQTTLGQTPNYATPFRLFPPFSGIHHRYSPMAGTHFCNYLFFFFFSATLDLPPLILRFLGIQVGGFPTFTSRLFLFVPTLTATVSLAEPTVFVLCPGSFVHPWRDANPPPPFFENHSFPSPPPIMDRLCHCFVLLRTPHC